MGGGKDVQGRTKRKGLTPGERKGKTEEGCRGEKNRDWSHLATVKFLGGGLPHKSRQQVKEVSPGVEQGLLHVAANERDVVDRNPTPPTGEKREDLCGSKNPWG